MVAASDEERPIIALLSDDGTFSVIRYKGEDPLTFEQAHALFLKQHLAKRTGERKDRLERGHRHAEHLFLRNVIWPLRGTLDDIHPEYEVLDWRGRSYFADFMWLLGLVKLIIEIKGFGPHVRDMDRSKYSNELNRESFLHAMGYPVIAFTYDDIEQRPELCIMLLRMILARYQPEKPPVSRATLAEKEVIRLAIQAVEPIRPKDVALHYAIDAKTAVAMLRKLCDKGWMMPSPRGAGERNVRYALVKGVESLLE